MTPHEIEIASADPNRAAPDPRPRRAAPARFPYRAAYLPVDRLRDGTVHHHAGLLDRVLDVSLAELITDPRTPASAVLRADEGVWVSGSSVDARLLDRLDRHLRTDLYDIVIRAGSPQLSAAHQAGVIESFLCHDGSVRIGPSDEPVEISAGDFTRFRADVPHTYEAVGSNARGVLIIQTPWAVGPA